VQATAVEAAAAVVATEGAFAAEVVVGAAAA